MGVGGLSVGCSGGGVGWGDGLHSPVGVGVGTVSVNTSPPGSVVVIASTAVGTGTVNVIGSVVVTVNV